jgi:lysyl-tRNA synthetase class 2
MRKPTLTSERRPGYVGALYTDFGGKGQMGSLAIRRNLRSPLSPSSPPPFWSPDRHASRHARLRARARTAAVTRQWFGAKGFIEVDPAALQASPGNETHLHGFRVDMVGSSGTAREAWLHTSPEFAMKKLLAAGETQIFALTHVFRNRERTALHAPEFAMLEWYRVGASLARVMDDCAALLALAAHVAGAKVFAFRGREASPFEPPERVSVRDAFLRHAGIDLYDSLPLGAEPDAARLARQAEATGLRVARDDTWSDVFSRLLSERVEPNLGIGRPTILHAYPASEAALARVSPDDPRVAERFELYCCGVELANAFHELNDPVEQRDRFEADMGEQRRIYGAAHPIDEDFLAAVGAMPDACGAALGFDRLVMLATGADSVEAVQWTPVFDPGAGA